MAERGWGSRLSGVRLRAALAATVVVAVFLGAAAVAFVLLLRHQLEASLTDIASRQSTDVASQVAQEGVAVNVVRGAGDQSLIQVIDASGSVAASSPSIDGEPPVVTSRPGPGQVVTVRVDRLPIGEPDRFVVIARGTSSPDGDMVIVAAQSLGSVQRSTATVTGLLALGFPLVLAGVGLTSFWLTGRALAPVELMRRRVALIEGTAELSARVPVPGGNDEIARLAETMNTMLARLESSVDAQRRFVGDASHELRSPLATIRAAQEIGALHPETTDWTRTSREILDELDRVDRVVADMLLLARADERGLSLRSEEVDLDDLVRAEAIRLRGGGLVGASLTGPPIRIVGDRHLLARLLRNLADNAARHAVSRVEFRLQADATTARVEVVDDGPGIPAPDLERVFERFVRLDESRARESGGVGLGLPIARQVARAHGGDLSATDSPRGACFVLTLPRGPAAETSVVE